VSRGKEQATVLQKKLQKSFEKVLTNKSKGAIIKAQKNKRSH